MVKKKVQRQRLRNDSFAHFCHDSNVRHFYPHNPKCQFDVKRGSLGMQVTPKISKYLSMRHHQAGTQSFALVFYLYGPPI